MLTLAAPRNPRPGVGPGVQQGSRTPSVPAPPRLCTRLPGGAEALLFSSSAGVENIMAH